MRQYLSKIILFSLCLTLSLYLLVPTFQSMAQDTEPAQPAQLSEPMSPEDVDNHLAGMSDEQVRQAYAQKMKEDLEKQSVASPDSGEESTGNRVLDTFFNSARSARAGLNRLGAILTGERSSNIQWSTEVAKLSGAKGAPYLLGTMAAVVLIIALGLVMRWLFLRNTADIRKNLMKAVRLGKLEFLGRVLSRALLDAIGIGVYIVTTFILFVLIYQEGKPSYIIVSAFLIVSYYVIVFDFGARLIFAPKAPALRLFPMEDRDASFMYNWIFRMLMIAGFFAGVSRVFRVVGVGGQLYLMVYALSGAVVILAVVAMIWQSRKRVGEAIWTEDAATGTGRGSLRAGFAGSWHYFAILYVLIAGGIWVAKVLNQELVTVQNLILSLFLIPVVIGVDQWIQRLLKMASGESRETIDLSGDAPLDDEQLPEEGGKMDIAHYVPLIRRFFRVFLVAFLFFGALRLWGIDLPIGRVFTRSALTILGILLFSFVAWQLIKARIDQKLQEEMPDEDEDAEEGGAGGSRIGTLLVLLRKFVLAVMFVMVTLIILASMGINIGPLIAGAGVIGLAIGFGAQTLVKDIIAGVFFLIDDAFRVGDFIEVSGTKGSVEHISLRSLRLRNPRGPVHTIPFGSMGTVTNNSRDYIITKLDFRVRYDTDVEKVRKIIKRINAVIEKDPEMGPNLLDKIKSQGVRELDDSAMIMRLKFKTIPGEQFVIRREVYRMVQEYFREFGVEFAHRNVTVYMPPDEEGEEHDKNADAGAAAATAVAQVEAEAMATQKPQKK